MVNNTRGRGRGRRRGRGTVRDEVMEGKRSYPLRNRTASSNNKTLVVCSTTPIKDDVQFEHDDDVNGVHNASPQPRRSETRRISDDILKLDAQNASPILDSAAQVALNCSTLQPSEAVCSMPNEATKDKGSAEEDVEVDANMNETLFATTVTSPLANGDASTSRTVGDVASNNNRDPQERSSNCYQRPSTSLNLTEMAEQMDDDLSDIDSLGCDSGLVSVNGYRVKPQYADTLRSILSKHGDIAADCSLGSLTFRSFCMELLCDTLHKLMNINFINITDVELDNMMASVNDIEGEKIEVGWIKKRFTEIREAKLAVPLLRSSSNLKQQKAEWKAKIEEIKKQLGSYESAFQVKLEEAREIQKKIDAAHQDLSVAEAEAKKTEYMISASRAKVRHAVELGPLGNGLI